MLAPLLRLLLAAALLIAPVHAAEPPLVEVAVMRKLRQALRDANVSWSAQPLPGWAGNDAQHPCEWPRVKCDDQRHITYLGLYEGWHTTHAQDVEGVRVDLQAAPAGGATSAAGPPGAPPLPILLPELAQLQWLEELVVDMDAPLAGIPGEWGRPGAFPRLQRLSIVARGLEGGLPVLEPGALPRLEGLYLELRSGPPVDLPPSWGASPEVLPSLQTLVLNAARLRGPLPAAWARGFRCLERLRVSCGQSRALTEGRPRAPSDSLGQEQRGGAGPSSCGPGERRALPPEWPSGFPALAELALSLDLSGTVPPAWWDSGFGRLAELTLSDNALSGTLPAHVFQTHPSLRRLSLDNNLFEGPLPDAWAESAVELIVASNNPGLAGPAFPPAWLAEGAMRGLEELRLSFNEGLTGSLPPSLPWPRLYSLDVTGAGVSGPVPERWCAGGVAPNLTHVWISHDPQQGSALPACAARQLPHLIAHWPGGMEFAGRTRLKSGVPPPPRPAPSRSSGAGGLEALLVVAAVAACMAASRVLWVRRRAAQRPGPSGRRARPLEQPLSSVGVQSEAGVTNGAGPAQQLHRRRRRRQFEMMLQSEPSRLSVLPLEQLPHALMAHRLRSARPAPASSRGSQPADDDGTERSSLLPQPADSAAATGGGGCAWALETDSLRLQPEALELVLDQQGGLVELGAGAYAEVFLGRVQGREVAVKVFQLPPGDACAAAWNEVALLRRCAHERICAILGVCLLDNVLMLVMELARRGSLRTALQGEEGRRELRWGARGRQVAVDVATALHFLHTHHRVMHADLKSGNVLLSADWRACLSDLGVARALGSMSGEAGFSCTHAAPEQLLGERCGLAADMYQLGVLLVELTTQRMVRRRGEWSLPRAGLDCPQEVVELIVACVAQDPRQRPSASEALEVLQRLPAAGEPD